MNQEQKIFKNRLINNYYQLGFSKTLHNVFLNRENKILLSQLEVMESYGINTIEKQEMIDSYLKGFAHQLWNQDNLIISEDSIKFPNTLDKYAIQICFQNKDIQQRVFNYYQTYKKAFIQSLMDYNESLNEASALELLGKSKKAHCCA